MNTSLHNLSLIKTAASRVFLLLALFALGGSAAAQVVVDSYSASASAASGSTSIYWNHTVNTTDPNRVLVVEEVGHGSGTNTPSWGSVSFDGVSMTVAAYVGVNTDVMQTWVLQRRQRGRRHGHRGRRQSQSGQHHLPDHPG
jgi:hypothetical protein